MVEVSNFTEKLSLPLLLKQLRENNNLIINDCFANQEKLTESIVNELREFYELSESLVIKLGSELGN